MLNPQEFDMDIIAETPILKRSKGNPGCKVKYNYKDIIMAFDIETTRLPINQSIMYSWQWQIGKEHTIIGRTWDEFIEFCKRISINLADNERVIVFVHNLAFEFTFLQGIYTFSNEDIFAIDRRKPVKLVMYNHIEFRCTAVQTNMSLDMLTNSLNVKHKKLSGVEFNYEAIRYPWTPITDEEYKYMQNDVLGLVEAMEKRMELNNDNLYTLPLTSTGYVRRDFKQITANIYHSRMLPILPDSEIYKMLRNAFRGGDVHANRYYATHTLYNVNSYDRQSSYPDVLVNCKYPLSKFIELEDISKESIEKQIYIRHKAVLMEVEVYNITLKNEYEGCPYISLSKISNYRKTNNLIVDNGRVIACDHFRLTITDIDYKIIKDMYTFDMRCIKVYTSRYGKLPDEIRRLILSYFVKKCELKHAISIKRKAKEDVEELQLQYDKFKNLINAIYGLMAQNPIQVNIKYNGIDHCCTYTDCDLFNRSECLDKIWCDKSTEPNDMLAMQAKSKAIPYQWGVWTCANARYELHQGRKCIDIDSFVYCDTDSIKFIGNFDSNIDKLNAHYIERDIENHAYAIAGNEIYYLGIYENEGVYTHFKTWGAKKYIYIKNGLFKMTVSGIRKGENEIKNKHMIIAMCLKNNLQLLKYYLTNINLIAFNDVDIGYTFFSSAGLQAIYNDKIDTNIRVLEVDNNTIFITSNLTLVPSTYTLGVSKEYEELLTSLDI